MTADQPPPAAVQIACDALVTISARPIAVARPVVAALAERYAFVDHAEYTRLVAAEKAARTFRDRVGRGMSGELDAALDAAPVETTAEGEPPPAGAGLPRFCP